MKTSEDPRCAGCPLARLFPNSEVVPPQMGQSKRLVLAEAPGETEEQLGAPLVGGSGKVFNSLLRKAGIQRESLTIINTVNCRPQENAYPTDAPARKYCTANEGAEAVSHCYREHVKPLLLSREWDRVDLLGAKALKSITGLSDITKWRGSPLEVTIDGAKLHCMPTLHPAFVMRCQEYMPVVISDLTKGLTPPPEYYNLIPTLNDLMDWNPRRASVDIETNRFTEQITMVGIAEKPFYSIVIPYKGAYIQEVKRILGGLEEFIGQNCLQFDIPTLEKAGIKFKEDMQVWDIMLMFHLLHPDAPANDLEFISSIYTQKPAWKHLSNEDMALYNARDVDVTLQTFLQLKPLLRMQKLEELYLWTQVPLAKICGLMTETGIKCDGNRIKYVREKLAKEVEELEKTLPEGLRPYDKVIKVRHKAPEGTLGKSGKPIKFIHIARTEQCVPWSSPKQVERYLYETLALPKQLHPKTKKVTTDKGALDKLYRRTKNPIVATLKRLRQVENLRTTFLKEGTVGVGRVHANFLVHGTNSGRLSSSGPDLQNLNATAKYIYVPSHEGWVFVEGDFSSLENRLTAWYANDTDRLAKLSTPGYNEHKETTSVIFGIPIGEINKEMPEYRLGKAANHAANYGLGARKFAMTYDISEKEARDILYKWKAAHPQTVAWQEHTAKEAEINGFLSTVFGRKRWFWTTSLYTESLSFKPQSTGADISFRAMVALMYERIHWPPELALKTIDVLSPLPWPARLIAQVHDSLLVECPQDKVYEVVKAMNAAMSQPFKELGGYSIPAAFKIGKPGDSWAEIEEINLEEYLK